VNSVDAHFAECGSHDTAGDALAVADNQVRNARGEFEYRSKPAQNFIEESNF